MLPSTVLLPKSIHCMHDYRVSSLVLGFLTRDSCIGRFHAKNHKLSHSLPISHRGLYFDKIIDRNNDEKVCFVIDCGPGELVGSDFLGLVQAYVCYC